MKRSIVAVSAALGILAACYGCKGSPAIKSADELNDALGAAVSAFDAYMETHNYTNTSPKDLAAEAKKTAAALASIAVEGEKAKAATGDGEYDVVIARAREGEKIVTALAPRLAAGPPAGDAAKAADLAAAIAAWGTYSSGVADAARLPSKTHPKGTGKRHHYGWYKNPAWARDPAARGTAATAGTAVPERRIRERDRERERENYPPGQERGKGRGDKGGSQRKGDDNENFRGGPSGKGNAKGGNR